MEAAIAEDSGLVAISSKPDKPDMRRAAGRMVFVPSG
jgi:hypothetical protein